MSPTTHAGPITIRGPFWEADAVVLGEHFPPGNRETALYFRTLFVESTARQALGAEQAHLPGTMLALVWVSRVRIMPVPGRTARWTRGEESPPILETEEQLRAAVATGRASLLLIQVHPENIATGAAGPFTCVGGEIVLHTVQPPDGVEPLGTLEGFGALWADCGLAGVDQCRVHVSGLSVHAATAVPWETNPLTAWFMLSVDLPHAAERSEDRYHLTLEHERMSAVELTALRQAWQNLSRFANPRHPHNDIAGGVAVQTPGWVTFEFVEPRAAPNFFWTLAGWGAGAPVRRLCFDTSEVTVLLTDQQPYPGAGEPAPTSLAQIIPYSASIERVDDDTLRVTMAAGETGQAVSPCETLHYAWLRRQQAEGIQCDQLLVAFDPVQTATFLRSIQNQAAPGLRRDEEGDIIGRPFKPEQPLRMQDYDVPLLDPPLLWGFMPLEDGWAQLPFLNVTEQVYVDLRLAQPVPATDLSRQPVLRGAVHLGNDDPAVLAGYCDEQPWNLTLVGASHVLGAWELKREDGRYRLEQVSLVIDGPVVYLNGLLWLSTGRPTVEDALPDLSRWVSALRPIPLRSLCEADDVFPPLVRLRLEGLGLTLRPTIANRCGDPNAAEIRKASAHLGALTLSLDVDDALFGRLTANRDADGNAIPPALAPDTFARHLPLIWRRHPRLPMVQALPMTQSRHAPNHPGASRQLVPFALETGGDPLPLPTAEWRFALAGAHVWPRLGGQAVIAPEWAAASAADGQPGFSDLPLVALSLPGVELAPYAGAGEWGLPADSAFQLAPQLRFDLPYLDQIHALAEVPQTGLRTTETSPLPDQPPPEPPAPLSRETYAAYWRTLAERASLARADAIDALWRQDAVTFVQHLIEPLRWPVDAALDLSAYPGAMRLANAGGGAELVLTEEAALRGVDGDFVADSGGLLCRLTAPDGNGSYHVVAGTMAAQPEAGGAYRDQRGLLRWAAHSRGPGLIKTPVTLHKATDVTEAYELASVVQPLTLAAGGQPWAAFWFRDLPLQAETQQFERTTTLSPEAKARNTDVNDPDALAREYNFLAGYQWHMGPVVVDQPGLTLGGLHIHPLTLETLTLQDNLVNEVVLTGRLQLPIRGYEELTDLSNAVTFTFRREAGGTLALSQVALADAGAPGSHGEWPLDLLDGELTAAPRLTWARIELAPDRTGLTVSDLALHFYLFEAPWTIALEPITFPFAGVQQVIVTQASLISAAPPDGADVPLLPLSVSLTLDLPQAQGGGGQAAPLPDETAASPHRCELSLQVQLGQRRQSGGDAAADKRRAAFDALITFPLLGDAEPIWQSATLFNDLLLDTGASPQGAGGPGHICKQGTLQFRWTRFAPRPELDQPLELLPGIPLARSQTGGEYAPAPGFAVLRFTALPNAGVPDLTLQMGYVEALLTCQWGRYLADLPAGADLPLDTVREALFGSSAGHLVFAYTSSFPVQPSGWDESFMFNGFVEVKDLISWPRALHYDGQQAVLTLPSSRDSSLDHLRHSIRILFNQHEILPALPVIGDAHRLFNFGARPWQFLAVVEHQLARLRLDAQRVRLDGEQRWTAVQEVRLCTPAALGATLALDRQFPSPLAGSHEPVSAGLSNTQEDINQIMWLSTTGQVRRTEISYNPRQYLEVPHWVPNDVHWVGSYNPLTRTKSFLGFRFVVRNVPRGAHIHSAAVTATAISVLGAVPGRPIRISLYVERAVDRAKFSPTHLISDADDHLLRAPELENIVITEEWHTNQRVLLGDIAPLVQELVDLEAWNPQESVVTVVIEGTADLAFMRKYGYPTNKPEQDVFRYITGTSARLDLEFGLPVNQAALGVFAETLRPLLLAEVQALPQANMLFVEASAPFWLRPQRADESAAGQPTLTALQYLPNGTQLAILSNPQDYAPNNPQGGDTIWQLLLMPFLGRLQPAALDTGAASALQADPVWLIHQRNQAAAGQAFPPLALALANLGDDAAVTFDVSRFESLALRGLARLDRSTLQENWFRLQRLLPEPPPASLRSVMAALPNTPARYSRDVALRRLFDSLRRHYPPKLPPLTQERADAQGEPLYVLPAAVDDALLIWRQASLLILQGVSRPREDGVPADADTPASAGTAYGWHLVGLQVSELAASAEEPLTIFPAATLLPAWNAPDDTLPVSFAVSPYLGLAFHAIPPEAAGDRPIALELVELLAIDPVLNTLRPVASLVRDSGVRDSGVRDGADTAESPEARATTINTWAIETQMRLAPESPIAVIRLRQVHQSTGSLITAQYAHQLVDVPGVSRTLARRTLRLRTEADRLRFRQGQFSPHPLPDGVKAFEVAAPLTTGVQPIYQVTAAPRVADRESVTPDWPWGLSALRVAVQYTPGQEGVAAAQALLAPDRLLLWWQSLQYGVQFRPASGATRPAASLPDLFRARAIRTLLPVNADPPMAALAPEDVTRGEPVRAGEPVLQFERWQPVLPGRLRYMVIGSRPGVPFVFRHLLLRQELGGGADRPRLVVSGSVPVQHRAPRPVPLPANRPANGQGDDGRGGDGQYPGAAFALQPWASHFMPQANALFSSSPVDETFQAPCGGQPARRLQVRLVSPASGVLTDGWRGELQFVLDWDPHLAANERWQLSFALAGNGANIPLNQEQASGLYDVRGTYRAAAPDADRSQEVAARVQFVQVRVELVKDTGGGAFYNDSGFYQLLALPLIYAGTETERLPLEPVFCHFEDPEYNRQLGSAAGYSVSLFDAREQNGEVVAHELRLSLDRKAYNPTSELVFRYDWDNPAVLDAPDAETVRLSHIAAAGTSELLAQWPVTGQPETRVASGQLQIASLGELVAAFNADLDPAAAPRLLRAGDRLELKALFAQGKEIAVEVDIVEEPVIPAPEAAFALLRRRPDGEDTVVEAARFAWNPEAARVELVCAEDLRSGFVRRRGVFHWQDAARPSRDVRYAVQKIAASGSTHWPPFAELLRS
jgi:hypothetical protein